MFSATAGTLALAFRVMITTGALVIGVALLPNGADYPFPPQAVTAIQTAYHWMYSLNMLFPVDTLIQVAYYGIIITIFTKLVWPTVFWLFKTVTGGGE